MISVESISKKFGDKQVLNDLSFVVNDNESIGIVAPNGSGKTVILEMLIGKLRSEKGKIFLPQDIKKNIFYQPQKDCFPENMLVRETVDFYLRIYKKKINRKDIEFYLDRYNISDLRNKRVTKLSGGQQRKLSMVLALILQPKVLILDEPTAGVDLKSIRLFRHDLTRINNSIKILTSHNSEDLQEITDRMLFLKNGKIQKEIVNNEYKKFDEIYNAMYLEEELED